LLCDPSALEWGSRRAFVLSRACSPLRRGYHCAQTGPMSSLRSIQAVSSCSWKLTLACRFLKHSQAFSSAMNTDEVQMNRAGQRLVTDLRAPPNSAIEGTVCKRLRRFHPAPHRDRYPPRGAPPKAAVPDNHRRRCNDRGTRLSSSRASPPKQVSGTYRIGLPFGRSVLPYRLALLEMPLRRTAPLTRPCNALFGKLIPRRLLEVNLVRDPRTVCTGMQSPSADGLTG
jgi:hypothetical protein